MQLGFRVFVDLVVEMINEENPGAENPHPKKVFVGTKKPSMGQVYLPTWKVHFYGKCREIYPNMDAMG